MLPTDVGSGFTERWALTGCDECCGYGHTLMFLGVRTDPGDGVWLDHWLHGRAEIHQTTGMVLAQLGVSATVALARRSSSGCHSTRDSSHVSMVGSTLLNGGGEAGAHLVSSVTFWVSDRTVCRWGAKG